MKHLNIDKVCETANISFYRTIKFFEHEASFEPVRIKKLKSELRFCDFLCNKDEIIAKYYKNPSNDDKVLRQLSSHLNKLAQRKLKLNLASNEITKNIINISGPDSWQSEIGNKIDKEIENAKKHPYTNYYIVCSEFKIEGIGKTPEEAIEDSGISITNVDWHNKYFKLFGCTETLCKQVCRWEPDGYRRYQKYTKHIKLNNGVMGTLEER